MYVGKDVVGDSVGLKSTAGRFVGDFVGSWVIVGCSVMYDGAAVGKSVGSKVRWRIGVSVG